LARQGFDTEKLTQNLSSIDLKTTFEPLESISETDLESYLKHEHELIVLSAIEEAKKEVMTIILIQALFNFHHFLLFSIGSRSA
jgi:nuclear pore complex protein Nup93